MQNLLAAVRKACPPGLWSQGVKLARDGAVLKESGSGSELNLRVRSPGRVVPPSVVLYPDDGEWTCDCGGRMDPCEHVAAAVIALTQGSEPGRAVATTTSAGGTLRYRLRRKDGTLAFERSIVQPDGSEVPLATSLSSALARTGGAMGLSPSHDDLVIDRIVGGRQRGWFPAARLIELFTALCTSHDLWLDGEQVKASGESIPPAGRVVDEGDGVAIVIDRDPRIGAIVAGEIVRIDDTLHPMRETELTGPRLEKLPLRRVFRKEELGTFVTELLPDLMKRMPIEIVTDRLPRTEATGRPRIAFELTHDARGLSVLPLLVYGDPPQARVDAGDLVHLGGAVPARDRRAENVLIGRLRDELNLVPGRRVVFEGADAPRFAARLEAWEAIAGGDAHRALARRGMLTPHLVVGGRAFELTFDLASNEGDCTADSAPGGVATAEAVLKAWHEGLPLVPLDGGGWATVPNEWLDRYGALVADLLAARRSDGEVATVALPAMAELCCALEQPPPPGFERLVPLLEGFSTIPDVAAPADLRAELRPYQARGISWLCFLRDAGLGAVLADDMGLGKTLQALCAIQGRTLVVCPRSVVHNWAAEIRRFRPALNVSLYHGPKRSLDRSADVTLTTYAVLRLDAERITSEAWDTVVLDEAQAIKNPDSQVARVAYALRASFRISLSGTPVENRLDELWSQLHFTNPGLLGGRGGFQSRYERPIAAGDADTAAALRKKTRPFVLRRMKSEVAPELPPRTESVLYCELDERERAVYDAVRAATKKEVVARMATGMSVIAALEALLRLRQAACHAGLVPGQEAESSSKIERLLEALEDAAADGHKALVFSQWTSLLDRIEPHLGAAGIRFTRLDGSTRDRAGVVASFQDRDGPPVMLVSLKAGGTGLNLTAADHVFLVDPWWNPAVEDQAADRAHRIGQDRPVMVYRLVAKDTVEEGILALQERKRAVADAALGEAGSAAAITRDDLLALLG